jgi:hypothetical protein
MSARDDLSVAKRGFIEHINSELGRFNEGNEHMSNEQTVREALEPSVPTWTLEHACNVLGIDPAMTVSELHRRKRLLDSLPDVIKKLNSLIARLDMGDWRDLNYADELRDVVSLLTREDDQ